MGRRIQLTNGRRLVSDLVRIGKSYPSAGIQGDFDAGLVANLRRRTRPKISWNVLYLKAYGAVAMQIPELRRNFVRFPWGHFYEHDKTVCMMTISREYQGEERLFFARFGNPQDCSLAELQKRYDYFRREPVEEIKQFRHQINFAKAPGILRRLGWFVMCELWPAKRASHVGTIGMSLSGYKGTFGNQHLGPMTTVLGVDPMPRKGVSRLVLTFDHRVLDGVPAAKVLQQLQHVLTTAIREELAEMVGADPETGEPLHKAA